MTAALPVPGAVLGEALAASVAGWLRKDWLASGLGRWALARPRPDGFAIQPRDFRPVDVAAGERILAGAFVLAGQTLAVGPRGDPFDAASPSLAFAAQLHGFAWLGDLCAAGDAGAVEALRFHLDWRRSFGRWNRFAWSPEVLARRTFNLACHGRALAARASDAEVAKLSADLTRSGRTLLALGGGPGAAERAAAAAVAGASLGGKGGDTLRRAAVRALERALPQSVGMDGAHRSRSPQAALELLFDLKTLDEALTQRGMAAPASVLRAIDGLAAAVRFYTLDDGALAAFHGGAACARTYVAAARAQDEAEARHEPLALGGYHRLQGRSMQVVVDTAPPPAGAWSVAAAVQPLGFEILVDGRRLLGPGAGRGLESGCTLAVGPMDGSTWRCYRLLTERGTEPRAAW